MGLLGPKNYRVADLYDGLCHENGNSLFWIQRTVAIGAVLEKDYNKAITENSSAAVSSIVGTLSGITAVKKQEDPETVRCYRLSIGNEIAIVSTDSALALFPRDI